MADGEIKHVRIGYASLPPFVVIKEKDGEEIFDGFMPVIVKTVIKWMNLNVTWIREPNDLYGAWNGTHFTGMVGMVHRGEVDFIMNPVIPTAEHMSFMTFTLPIIYEAFTSISGKEKIGGGLFLYFTVLEPLVWYFIFITLICISVVSSILYLRLGDKLASKITALSEYTWVYTVSMLRQVTNEKWMLRKKKSTLSFLMPFLQLTWMIGVSFTIMTVFQSLLVSKLTIIRQQPVVDSLQEFVAKKSVKGITPREIELQLVLKDSPIPLYDEAWTKLEPELVPAAELFSHESLQAVERGKLCIYHGHLILRSALSDFFKKRGTCNIHLSENYFFPFPLLMAINKTLPQSFINKLKYGISRMVEVDISGKWFKPIYEEAHLCTSYSETNLKPLNLNNIVGVIIIWFGGITAATISLIAERLYFASFEGKKAQKVKANRTKRL